MPNIDVGNINSRLLKKLYWSGINLQYKKTSLYLLCVRHKPRSIPTAPLQEMFIPSRPGDLV